MRFSLEPLASLATIVGTVVSILALMQSSAWIIATGVIVAGLGVVTVLYARQKRLKLDSASAMIEGQSIDSLNIANLRRRVSRTLFVQEAFHTVRIAGEDMEINWTYSGYCRAAGGASFDFSVDSEDSTPFAKLDCVAFDLGRDPEMMFKIRPILIGTDGISKKISVPFLSTLKAKEPFRVMLKCRLPRCLSPGSAYYTSTLSFGQDRVGRCTVELLFVGDPPTWVRVYENRPDQSPVLLKSLVPTHHEAGISKYVDVAEDRPGQSTRVYMFWRNSI